MELARRPKFVYQFQMHWEFLTPQTGTFFVTSQYACEPGDTYDRVRVGKVQEHVGRWLDDNIRGPWEVKIVEVPRTRDGFWVRPKDFSEPYTADDRRAGLEKSEAIIIGFTDIQDAAKFKLFWG